MKKVLILTSIKTGSGHHAASKAIEKKLNDKGYETRQLDVFPLMGRLGRLMEESYIPLTTKAPYVFYAGERTSDHFPWMVHWPMYRRVRKNLLKEVREFEPDLIISVHCMFTVAISKIIRKYKLDIPFYIGVVDLIDPPKVWQDRDAEMTFVPTKDIEEQYLQDGFSRDRVLVSGFPVRDDIVCKIQEKPQHEKKRILMINPSPVLNKNIAFLKEVSRLADIDIDFVCGLDERLHQTLDKMKQEGELPANVTVHGFVNNVNELLYNCDVVLTKAGPNMIIEALHSGTPIVITGHIKGQENHNYRYVVENGLGVKCEDPDQIYETLKEMITSDLDTYRQNIIDQKMKNGAEFIAEYVSEHIKD